MMKKHGRFFQLRNHWGFILWPFSFVFLPRETWNFFGDLKRSRFKFAREQGKFAPAYLIKPGGSPPLEEEVTYVDD